MEKKVDLIIKNATLVSSSESIVADIAVIDKKIARVEKNISLPADKIFNADGLHVLPGVIDSQVHFREPGLTHKEDIHTGSMAAVLGGVTTYLEMPNTQPPTITIESVQEKINLAQGRSFAHYGFFLGATNQNLNEILKGEKEMKGLCGIKIFLGSSTGSLLLFDEESIFKILEKSSLPIAIHSESEKILKERSQLRDNAANVHAHYQWRNPQSALLSTQWILELAKKAGRKVHVLHISTKEEIEFLRANKEACTFELTPQHLSFHAPDIYDQIGTLAQMNPPIRTIEHCQALWEAMDEEMPHVLGSDHAPHTLAEKGLPYPQSPSGMPGVQTLVPVMLDHVIKGRLTLERLVALLCENPAELYSLPQKGRIEVGLDADFTVVNLQGKYVVKNEDMASKCGWTPFANRELAGQVFATFIDGQMVMKEGKIIGAPIGRPIQRKIKKI